MTAISINSDTDTIIEEGNGRSIYNALNKLKSGYTPAAKDVLVAKDVVDITTQAVVGLSAPVLVGMKDANTTNGLLYGKIINGSGGAGDAYVVLYSDAARSAEVAKSDNLTRATMTVATMSESNSSGISGTINILANTANSADQVFTTRKEYSRYDGNALTGNEIQGIISEYDSVTGIIKTYARPTKAVMDKVGFSNLTEVFGRNDLRVAALLKNIELV